MSTKSDPNFVLVKERLPYSGKGIDELITSVRRILTEPSNKYTQKVVLEVGAPHIYLERLVPKTEAGEIVQLSLHDAIRNARMEEYELENMVAAHPFQHLADMFSVVRAEGLEVGFIVAGERKKFMNWLGIRIPANNMQVLGTPFEVVGDIPSDVFIVCGTPTRTAEPDDIRFALKVTI